MIRNGANRHSGTIWFQVRRIVAATIGDHVVLIVRTLASFSRVLQIVNITFGLFIRTFTIWRSETADLLKSNANRCGSSDMNIISKDVWKRIFGLIVDENSHTASI